MRAELFLTALLAGSAGAEPRDAAELRMHEPLDRRSSPFSRWALRGRALLSELIGDGTAGSFGALVYLELEELSAIGRSLPLQAKLWEILAEDAKASSPIALLAASRLSRSEAISVVTRRLTEP